MRRFRHGVAVRACGVRHVRPASLDVALRHLNARSTPRPAGLLIVYPMLAAAQTPADHDTMEIHTQALG